MNGSNSVRKLIPYPSAIAEDPNFILAELITPKLFIEIVFCNDLLILVVFQTYML